MNTNEFLAQATLKSNRFIYGVMGFVDAPKAHRFCRVKLHPFVAMVWCSESEVTDRVLERIENDGWLDPCIKEIKVLGEPLDIEDPPYPEELSKVLLGGVGLIVYCKEVQPPSN